MNNLRLGVAIRRLRQKYPRLFLVMVGDEPFVVRPLTRAEWASIQAMTASAFEREEAICQTAVVHPADIDWSKARAGFPSALAPVILDLSGFSRPEVPIALLEQARQSMQVFERQAETLIRAVFHVSLDELRNMDVHEFMEELARAEWALRRLYGIDQAIVIEPPSPPDKQELKRQLRAEGIDPMRVFPPEPDKPLVPTPFILGRLKPLSDAAADAVRMQLT